MPPKRVSGRKRKVKSKDDDDDNISDSDEDLYDEDPISEEDFTGSAKKRAKTSPSSESKGTRTSSRLQKAKIQSELKPMFKEVGNNNSVLFYETSEKTYSDKIIGFDMDDTLIKTISGKKFGQGKSDWQFLFPEVPEKLKQLHKDNYKLVIFSNQLGIGNSNISSESITEKIMDILNQLQIPFQIFLATQDDEYRKPATAVWKLMVDEYNNLVKPDLTQCTYVGDAAGRLNGWKEGHKKDFSCSDRKFARNCGINFVTPEEFFLNEKPAAFDWDGIDPKDIKSDLPLFTPPDPPLISDKQEVIICVGYPASGKSTFCKTHMEPKGYVWINQDVLKKKEKCLQACKVALDEGKSAIIDNNNYDINNRAIYIAAAKSKGVPVRCFYFQTPIALAKHLNVFREKLVGTKKVPGVAYHMYTKNLTVPTLSEGFTEIKQINFLPHFETPVAEKLFHEMT